MCYCGYMLKTFFIFWLIALLFLSSLAFVLFRLKSPEFLVTQAREVNLYGRLTANLEPVIQSTELERYGLAQPDVADVVKTAVDGERFYDFLGKYLDSNLNWLTGETEVINFSYELAPVKQRLVEEATTKIMTKYNALPVCTMAQLRTWSFDNGLPSCQLAAESARARDIEQDARSSAENLVKDLPAEIKITQPSERLTEIRYFVSIVLRGIWVIWLATTTLLLLYLILFRTGGFVGLAVAMLVVGLMQIGFSLIAWDWIAKNLSDMLGNSEARSLTPLAIDLVGAVLEVFKTVLGSISILFLSSGGLLLVLGIVSRVTRNKAVQLVQKS